MSFFVLLDASKGLLVSWSGNTEVSLFLVGIETKNFAQLVEAFVSTESSNMTIHSCSIIDVYYC